MLILKQNNPNSVPIPPAGKGTVFLNSNDDLSVKSSDGNVAVFPVAAGVNTEVYFNDAGSFGANANLTFNKTTAVLTVNGNVGATNIKTDNLLYANGTAWDLGGTPGGSNTYVQFNDAGDFGGEANFTFNKTTNLLTVNGNANFNNANLGNLATANFLAGTLTTNAQPNITSVGTLANLAVTGNATAANIYANSGTIGASLLAGALTTNAQPNVTSVGLLTGLRVGNTANASDFPNATVIVSQDNSGQSHFENIGLVGEAVADSGNTSTWGIGVLGEARANGATKATGVQGGAYVTNTNDTGAAVGVRGYATMTHAGGFNVGVLGNAAGSGLGNYAFYIQAGNVASIENDTLWDLIDNSNSAFAFNSTGKANIFAISTNDGNEGVTMSGTLSVTGNASAGNISTGGALSVTGNASAGNISTGGALSVTGNASAGNISTAGAVAASTLTSNIATGTAPLTVTSTTRVANLNVAYANVSDYVGAGSAQNGNFNIALISGTSGNVQPLGNTAFIANASNGALYATTFVGALSGAATTAGTVTTNAQPNITSVGTLTSLTVTGNASAGNLSTGGELSVTANVIAGNVYANSGTVGANLLTGTLTTNAQPNITSTGTLTSLTVTGNASAGNISTGGALSVTGNANVGNLGATGVVATTLGGTLTTNAQPNITSVGSLSSLTVTGNLAAANIATGGSMAAVGNVSGGNISTGGALSVTGNASAGNISTGGALSVTGNISSNANVVTDLIVGRTTSVTITAAGANQNINLVPTGTGTVNVGNFIISNVATPVAATDAATKQYVDDVAQGLHTHDSCNAATTGTLATISGGTVTYNNGTSGVGATLTTTGSYTTIDGVTLSDGMRILVKNEANAAHNGIYDRTSSTVLTRSADFDTPVEMAGGDFTFITAGTLYDNTGWVLTDPVTTVGTSNVNWTQFSGSGAFTAGTGLTLTGTQFSISNTTVTAGSYGNGDSVATFTVNGQGQLTAAANTVITANAANLTGTALNSGIVTSSLTSVGTLGSLAVTGNTTSGNVYANSGTIGANLLTGTLTTAAQPNITSVGTLTGLSVNGNITAANITANTGVFTGNGSGLTALNASNISSGTLDQARLANASATVNGTTVTLGASSTITANTTQTLTLGSYLTGTSFNGGTAVTATVDATTTNTASKVVARDANGSFDANIITATLSGAATTAGTVTTNAQPNITSVGTLTSLSVTGNVSAGNVTSTGTIGGAGATLLGNTLTTGANTTAGTVTGNWTLSAGSRWNATYADLAEKYVADKDYEPGTVLVFGGEFEVTEANTFDSTRVAGVVSTDPAYVMNAGCAGDHVAILALQGRVPVKVIGPVEKGDLMVSSLNGYAKANNEAKAGTIIGKSLENFNGEKGVIEVVIGRF